ncbi:hypothetical protein [Mycolicibacter icosiumassiliensis]|uniref:hypothetical protein n=1 Tax=Mycolicibacter icosiumassiliensis TaxID=1792835 RepID=UPI00082DDFD4|nr:hypothetical protein [Mycolicibacter icosiumassiliensis]
MKLTKPPKTVADLVTAHIDELRALTDHHGLKAWAESHDLMTQQRFPRFKKALLEHGIDYAALRSRAAQEKRDSATHGITLISDAKASARRFGVCDQDGDPVWYGRDFDEIGEQSAAEMAAAKKAVWLAGKIRQQQGLSVLALTLKVDAQWLTYANGESGGGKAAELRNAAAKAGIVLTVEWIPGTDNPADQYTVGGGYMKWQEGVDNIAVRALENA